MGVRGGVDGHAQWPDPDICSENFCATNIGGSCKSTTRGSRYRIRPARRKSTAMSWQETLFAGVICACLAAVIWASLQRKDDR